MNYRRQYELLIEKAQLRGSVDGYMERHHIVPRCMGGSNEKENLVELTAREHFLAHRLLYMWLRTREMAYAWRMMSWNGPTHQRPLNAKDYQRIKEAIAAVGISEAHRNAFTRKGDTNSSDHRRKIGEALKGRLHSLERRRKISNSLMGHSTSEVTRQKRRERMKSLPKHPCPTCCRLIGGGKGNVKSHVKACKGKGIVTISGTP
jgi:hypothetical protein